MSSIPVILLVRCIIGQSESASFRQIIRHKSMAGHSKWAQIKRQKGANDQKRGALFAKLSRGITLAVQEGGGIADPALNVPLRLALDKAKNANMPKDTMQRAIEKGSGSDTTVFETILYEGFLPGGAAVLIKTATDNRNRSYHELRVILEKQGGSMAGQGAVQYLFEHCGQAVFESSQVDSDQVLEIAQSIEATEIVETEDAMLVYYPFALIGKTPALERGEETYRAVTTVPVPDDMADQISQICMMLEDHPDVQAVFTNAVI